MKEIQLTQGFVAFVDDEDYELCVVYNWSLKPGGNGSLYAARWVGNDQHVTLHNFLMNPKEGEEVDHVDRNGLNCQRYNMRLGTRGQNMANREMPENISGYRGVYPNRIGTWVASIRHNKVLYHLGTHETPEEAARAYDEAARELHGEFATLNFP